MDEASVVSLTCTVTILFSKNVNGIVSKNKINNMQSMADKTIRFKRTIDPSYVEKGITYEEYRRLIDALIMVGRSTAKNQSESLLEYSKLNVARMKRLDKTIEIIPALKTIIEKIQSPQTWLVLTEGWCGDAAQIVPVFAQLAALNGNINLKFLLRDENLELMDLYLTDAKSRSIPKLIVANENLEELFTFGPRPDALQEIYYHMKANAFDNATIKEELHRWYAQDKTITIQKELLELLKQICVDCEEKKVA